MNTDRYCYGGFWRRLAAALIDQTILGFLYIFIMIAGMAAFQAGFGMDVSSWDPEVEKFGDVGKWWVAYQLLCGVVNAGYFIYFHGSWGQTPGKRLLGLKVIQTSGDAMTYGVAFLRWVGYIVSSVFLFMGYLWVAFDRRKQGWHDKIAATVVIRTDGGKEISLDKGQDII
ncbi:MAG: RDD family protein [Syntrophales bacterium]|nr:RDD family protein [Syntrophales bacterium]